MSRRRPPRAAGRGAPDANAPGPSPAPERASDPGPTRRWLFRGVVFAIPWLFLLALEAVLRVAGFGVPTAFVLRQEVAGEVRLLSNPTFTWLFFEPGLARLYPPFSLAIQKPQNACRIFVLGSSAAEGDPEPSFGLARLLEVLLREEYPGVDFEVVNAAATAVNSHAIYRVARACAGLEPDVFVIYAGNNEVVGPFGGGTVLSAAAPSVPLVRAGLDLRATRVGQALVRLVRAASRRAGRPGPPSSWGGMEMFLQRQLRASDPALERTYRNYAQNLADTLAVARREGVPVVVSTVAVNLRACGPFASLHRPDLPASDLARWDALYAEGVRLQAEGRDGEAEGRFREAAAIDAEYAELQYRLGRCAWALGRFAEARQRYSQALELDTLRFRADRRINDTIRATAARFPSGVWLVDAAEQLAAASPHGVPGEEAFLDHVHPTFSGNYLLSTEILALLRQALPPAVRAKAVAHSLPSQQECARRLVYTQLDRYLIDETMLQRLSRPPFTAQMDHAAQLERFARERSALRAHGEAGAFEAALREYEQALASAPVHWTLRERHARIAQRSGDRATAERDWQRLTEELPQDPGLRLQLARCQREGGRFAEAEASLRTVLALQPGAPVALAELARVVLLQGRRDEAVATARRAVAADPGDANARYVLATGLCRAAICSSDERASAIAELEQALALAPDSPAVKRDLVRDLVRQGQELAARGQGSAGVRLLERALEIAPGLAELEEEAGVLYGQLNDRERARRHLAAALAAEPGRERARRALEALGR